jgi:aspartate aminotransferase
MNNSGYEDVRTTIAKSINSKFGTGFTQNNILMTVGAAGGLNVIFKTLLNPKDEVITFAPFFGEYRNYVANYEGELVIVSANTTNFQPNLEEFKEKINSKTKAVIINSPNNPTGVIYSEDTIIKLAAILNEKQKEFGTDIYLVSDEPYRELAYDDAEVPYLTKYYQNTIIGYSFSKSLSLPGERIGYLVIPDEAADSDDIIAAANIATRILGFVNAPSLFQRVIARCLDAKVDIEAYNRNRELLYNGLLSYGYQCIKPEGAFYMFVKTPIEDDVAFCNLAKQKNILAVPGSAFGCPGFVRIAYCVAYKTIEKALPGFKALIEEV